MQWADRKSPLRILLLLAAMLAAGWALGLYLCRCGDAPKGDVEPIAPEKMAELTANLRAHVHVLAGEIGERNVFQPHNLQKAADYLENFWRNLGYEVTRHVYDVRGVRSANIEISRRGAKNPDEIVLVGAHYDSVWGCPGANDNGSGVAAMLEISRAFLKISPKRTVRFVAFVNEEPPFFQTAQMGSRVYARDVRKRGDNIIAMLSLETIGYYNDEKNSQKYPPLFNFFYPDRGNFIAFVANFGSRPLLQRAVRAFRAHSDFPVECVSTFASVPGVDWSDHGSFWREGYQAFMVTDTALYRYPYYHTDWDTPDRVDYESLARVTDGLVAVVRELVGKP
jgi:Zn-dependent M28 family amino/carboxypeptidase